MKTPEQWISEYKMDGLRSLRQRYPDIKSFVESIQQDAIQSLSAKLPDSEVKRIADETVLKWYPIRDGESPFATIISEHREQLGKLIEQAILKALSLIRGGDVGLAEQNWMLRARCALWSASMQKYQSWKANGLATEQVQMLCDEYEKLSVFDDKQTKELMEDKKRLDWLEKNTSLHKEVEMLYLVDCYEVTQINDRNGSQLSHRGATLRTAISTAMGKDGE